MKKLIAHRRPRAISLSSAPLTLPEVPRDSSETFIKTLHLFQDIWNLEQLPSESKLNEFRKSHTALKTEVTPNMPISNALLDWMADKFELVEVVHKNPDLLTTLGEERDAEEFDPIKTHNVWIKLNRYVGNEKTAGLMYYLIGYPELQLSSILVKDSEGKTRQIQTTLKDAVPVDQYKSNELSFEKAEKDTEKMIMSTIMALLLGLHDDHGMNSVVVNGENGAYPVRFDHKHCGQEQPTSLLLEYAQDTNKFLSLRTYLWEFILKETPDLKPYANKILHSLQTVLDFCKIFSSENEAFTRLQTHIKITTRKLQTEIKKESSALPLTTLVQETHPHTLPITKLLMNNVINKLPGFSAGVVNALNYPLHLLVHNLFKSDTCRNEVTKVLAAYIFHCCPKAHNSATLKKVTAIVEKHFSKFQTQEEVHTISSDTIKKASDESILAVEKKFQIKLNKIFALDEDYQSPCSTHLLISSTKDVLEESAHSPVLEDEYNPEQSPKEVLRQSGVPELAGAV